MRKAETMTADTLSEFKLMIEAFGWRYAYLITGITGVVFALLALIFIVDPVRGRFEPRKPKVIEVIEEED